MCQAVSACEQQCEALNSPSFPVARITEQMYSYAMFTVEELGQEIAELAAHLDAATHRLLECIRQFDEECGWAAQGAVSCAHWLAWRIGLDPATAREKVRVARALGKLPAIDAALKSGKLSYAKVRALTRVATPENEAQVARGGAVRHRRAARTPVPRLPDRA